jgi:SRSO17 transposase
MKASELRRLDGALSEFSDWLVSGLGPEQRLRSLQWYVTGLLLDGERKSIDPMAGRLVEEPSRREAMRQRLQQAVVVARWTESMLYERLARRLDAELPGVEALVIDDTGFPKKGRHSVGVARQYSGTLGRTDNCQVAVSLHLASEMGSGCIGMRLFLPESWAEDRERRRLAGVPEDVSFKKKWELALDELDQALAWGIRRHVVLADAGYGDCGEFRQALTERGLHYVVGVQGTLMVWPPGSHPKAPRNDRRPGRPRTRIVDPHHPPQSIATVAAGLSYRTVTWRAGSLGKQRSRFAAVRVRTASQWTKGRPPSDEQWLLCEWPDDEKAPSKFYLSSLPEGISTKGLVRLAKLRWRVERDYQELKGEIGLDHFEGRTWNGFHHHAALCAAAHAFLALQRALFPPEDDEMDLAGGPPPAPALAPTAHRTLPHVPPTHGS